MSIRCIPILRKDVFSIRFTAYRALTVLFNIISYSLQLHFNLLIHIVLYLMHHLFARNFLVFLYLTSAAKLIVSVLTGRHYRCDTIQKVYKCGRISTRALLLVNLLIGYLLYHAYLPRTICLLLWWRIFVQKLIQISLPSVYFVHRHYSLSYNIILPLLDPPEFLKKKICLNLNEILCRDLMQILHSKSEISSDFASFLLSQHPLTNATNHKDLRSSLYLSLCDRRTSYALFANSCDQQLFVMKTYDFLLFGTWRVGIEKIVWMCIL